MRRILKSLVYGFGLLLMCCLVACEEDIKSSVLPTFAGFKLEPVVWHAGDKVRVTAVQKTLGDQLYRADYIWSVKCGDEEIIKNQKVVYDNDKSNPFFEFDLPIEANGTVDINFVANYQYSVAGQVEVHQNNNQPESGLFGKINITNSSVLEGVAKGGFSHQISK